MLKPPPRTPRARSLRREMTAAESTLWRYLRGRRLGGYKFRRQVPLGPFFLDFYCPAAKLAIEIDGAGHGEAGQRRYDTARTEALESEGIRVLRFLNEEILTTPEQVVAAIQRALNIGGLEGHQGPSPLPSPGGRGRRPSPLPGNPATDRANASQGGGKGGALAPPGRGKG